MGHEHQPGSGHATSNKPEPAQWKVGRGQVKGLYYGTRTIDIRTWHFLVMTEMIIVIIRVQHPVGGILVAEACGFGARGLKTQIFWHCAFQIHPN